MKIITYKENEGEVKTDSITAKVVYNGKKYRIELEPNVFYSQVFGHPPDYQTGYDKIWETRFLWRAKWKLQQLINETKKTERERTWKAI